MHICILGASAFGIATAVQLIGDGHDVVLIDRDRERLDSLSEELDCGLIIGDGTLPSTLRDAFGDGSDALVALTNQDEVNILAAVVGNSIGFDRVIPQIVRSELLAIAEELGLGETITPHESVAQSIAVALEQHSQVDATVFPRNELRIISVHVPVSMEAAVIGALDLPIGARAIVRIRDGVETLIDPETKLTENDHLLIVVEKENQQAVYDMFEPDTNLRQPNAV